MADLGKDHPTEIEAPTPVRGGGPKPRSPEAKPKQSKRARQENPAERERRRARDKERRQTEEYKQRHRESQRRYEERNREIVRTRRRKARDERRAADPEGYPSMMTAKKKDWERRNPEKAREYKRRYHERFPEKLRARRRQYKRRRRSRELAAKSVPFSKTQNGAFSSAVMSNRAYGAAHAAVPKTLPPHIRDDVISSIVLACLEGKVLLDEVPKKAKAFISAYWSGRDLFGTLSLDAPVGEDGATFLDLLEAPEHDHQEEAYG